MFLRSLDCELLCGNISCSNCFKQEKSVSKQKEKNNVQPPQPLKDKAPLSKSRTKRLVATVQRQRVVCKELEGRISQLEKEIAKNSVPIDETLEKDILAKLADSGDEITPHMYFICNAYIF